MFPPSSQTPLTPASIVSGEMLSKLGQRPAAPRFLWLTQHGLRVIALGAVLAARPRAESFR